MERRGLIPSIGAVWPICCEHERIYMLLQIMAGIPCTHAIATINKNGEDHVIRLSLLFEVHNNDFVRECHLPNQWDGQLAQES